MTGRFLSEEPSFVKGKKQEEMNMEKSIKINAYAKINLSLDVGEVMPNGMHPVDMIMQQISLHDEVTISIPESPGKENAPNIIISCDNPNLPADSGNIAYRAAEKMLLIAKEKCNNNNVDQPYHKEENKELTEKNFYANSLIAIDIDIKKNIPLAAGLAGGSSNAAAVIHGLNALLEMKLSLSELCEVGAELGSDVPFCILGQAKLNENLPNEIRQDPLATAAARATGTGTTLSPCPPLRAGMLLAKPEIGVSTKDAYLGIDRYFQECKTRGLKVKRPDNDAFVSALSNHDECAIKDNMINLLENYTLTAYPEVGELKELLKNRCPQSDKILMSGSGPTVYALFFGDADPIQLPSELSQYPYFFHLGELL